MARAQLETKLSLDDTSFRAGLRGAGMASQKFAKDSTMSMAKSVAAFAGGTLAVSALTRRFSELSQEFDRVGKLATRFQMPVEAVQKMSLAASLSGTSIERMNAALTKATVAGVEAQKGIKTYADAFADLNIDVAKFNALSPDEKIRVLGEAFSSAENEAVAFTAAYRILGKAGADLVPMLRDVAGAMEQAGEARFLSEDQVRRVEEMNDRMEVLSTTLKTDLMEAFLTLEPVITRMVGLVGDFANGLKSLGMGASVDDPTSPMFVEAGSALEPIKLGEREAMLRKNLANPNMPEKYRDDAESELARVMQRIRGLEERQRFIAESQSAAGQMRAQGMPEEQVSAFLNKRLDRLSKADRLDSIRSGAAAANAAAGDAINTLFTTKETTPATPAPVGPVPMPAGVSTMEALRRGAIETAPAGPDLFEAARRASSFTPTFKARGRSTKGRAVLGGGIDGIAAEGSSFGRVGFGGLAASMNAEANQRIGDPQALGGEKEQQAKQLDAGERQIQLLTEQNQLLKDNLTVK